MGETVQYACKEGFVLIGEPVIRCTEQGLWSHSVPFCESLILKYVDQFSFTQPSKLAGKRACRFPGNPPHGRVAPVKFLYEIGDRIIVQVCNFVPIAQHANRRTPQPVTHPTSSRITSAHSVAAGSTAHRRRRGGGSRGCSAWRAGGGPAASPGAPATEAADPCRCLNEQITAG